MQGHVVQLRRERCEQRLVEAIVGDHQCGAA
jgi:hypothetical protein